MLARDLAVRGPSIGVDDAAVDAVRLMAEQHLSGIVVCAPDGRPVRILPGTQVLALLIPPYVLDDPTLARMMSEHDSDRPAGDVRGSTMRELMPAHPVADLAVARPDDTVIELAVLMARTHSPLVAVVEDDRLIGCVTLPRVLDALLAPPPA